MEIFPSSIWQNALTGWRRVLTAAVAATDYCLGRFRLVSSTILRILSLLPSCGMSECRFVRTGVLLVLSLSCLVQLRAGAAREALLCLCSSRGLD